MVTEQIPLESGWSFPPAAEASRAVALTDWRAEKPPETVSTGHRQKELSYTDTNAQGKPLGWDQLSLRFTQGTIWEALVKKNDFLGLEYGNGEG